MRKLQWAVLALLGTAAAIPAVLARQSAPYAVDVRQHAGREWPAAGGDWGNTRYSTLTQIDTQNVKSLGAEWVSKKFEDGASSRVTPVVKDGLMFVTAGAKVYALDAKTGANVWTYQTQMQNLPRVFTNISTHDQGVPNSQGVAVGEGLVFVGLMNGHMLALDEKTGKPVWTEDLRPTPPRKTSQASAAPVYASGMVFCNLATVERFVGQVLALDAKTGKEVWHFNVIPAPGEAGHETWPPNSDIWKQGGGNPWHPPVVDADLGLVYWGTGNGNPLHVGEVRAGNNLYTASVIALDIKTGKLRWYFQTLHHDVWEGDVATPLVLYDTQVGGQTRKGIAAMRPDGYLFLLDRQTGKPLVPVQERPVPQDRYTKTSPTQPYPVGGESIVGDCDQWKGKIPAGFKLDCNLAPFYVEPLNVLSPGTGVRYEPMSFSPQTGYFYAQGQNSLEWRRRPEDPQFWNQGGLARRVPGINNGNTTVLAAIDSKTDKIVWKKEFASSGGFGSGGSLSTAGGLMFHRNGINGNLEAYDAKTGDLLWQFQTGQAGGDASAMSYEIDAQQYIAVVEGQEVWAFKLGGAVAPRPVPRIPPANNEPFAGPIQDVTQIETSSLNQEDQYLSGTRYFVDDYGFNPYRARVKAGSPVSFINNGHQAHTIVAQDGSWTTGTLEPRETATITFDKPGTYVYTCKEHPFSYGQLIVVADSAAGGGAGAPGGFANQVQRGKVAYAQSCSPCHMQDLSGNGEASPALAGTNFVRRWQGRTAADLYDKIRTTMPTGAPASLSQQQYLDITAYLLQSNDVAAPKELSPETAKTVALSK